jgi:hypothetical protein
MASAQRLALRLNKIKEMARMYPRNFKGCRCPRAERKNTSFGYEHAAAKTV